ncbi:MAG: hypothetical protein WKF35_01830 [Ferruginibacter sp.]
MKRFYIIASILSSFVLFACSSSDSPGYDKSLSPAISTKAVTPLTIADTLLSDTTTSNSSISNIPVTSPVVTSTASSANTAGLNPAHGMPGHRCDIEVGAPLSSPIQNKIAPKVQPSPVMASPSMQQPSVQSNSIGAGKPNPPHGQPGHDCAVPVGSPLKN